MDITKPAYYDENIINGVTLKFPYQVVWPTNLDPTSTLNMNKTPPMKTMVHEVSLIIFLFGRF